MKWQHVDESLAAYALGLLDPQQGTMVARHLQTCPRCQRMAGEYEAITGRILELQASATAADPPPELLARVMDEVQRTARPQPVARFTPREVPTASETAPRRLQPTWWRLPIAAAFVIALLATGIAGVEYQRARTQSEQQTQRLAMTESALAVLADSRVQRQPLQSMPGAPDGVVGQVYTAYDGQAVVIVVDHLPPAPPGQSYQANIRLDGEELALGALQVDAGGRGIVVSRLPGSSQIQQARVTLTQSPSATGSNQRTILQAILSP